MQKERIAKMIARAGLCSRREAEAWILAGRVKVDGKRIDSPALNVSTENKIEVDGKLLPQKQKTRLWLYHKPAGLMTTHKDPEGRPTVFSTLPKDMGRVISVGRLDLNSEGLLLLTNDGELARKLELPSTGLKRTYRVRIRGVLSEEKIAALKKGISVEGINYGSIEVKPDGGKDASRSTSEHAKRGGAERGQSLAPSRQNNWLRVSLHEGKNRELRRVFEHLGHVVSRLIRVQYGYYRLNDLAPCGISEVQVRD